MKEENFQGNSQGLEILIYEIKYTKLVLSKLDGPQDQKFYAPWILLQMTSNFEIVISKQIRKKYQRTSSKFFLEIKIENDLWLIRLEKNQPTEGQNFDIW